MELDISVENVRTVAELQRKDGRTKLGQLLGWEMAGFDEDAQMRDSILLDYLYESLVFGAQKGLPWPQVCAALQVAAEFQRETVGQPLSSAIKIYREISQRCLAGNRISEGNLRLFTSHLFETYMAHYQLYQIVFTTDREPMTVRQQLDVKPPPEAYPLDEAKPLTIWQYEHEMSEIEGEERSRMEGLRAQEEAIRAEMEQEEPFKQAPESASLLNREQVSQLIHDAITHHSSQTEKLLQTHVEERHEDLAYYLEKTALPRPEPLGPPPRTKEPPRLSAKGRAGSKLAGADAGKGASAKSKKSKKSAKAN